MQALAPEGIDYDFLADQLAPLGSAKRLRLLHFLRQPHYLEEVASELGLARYAAQRHLEQLMEIGAIQKIPGQRETGAVSDYILVPQRLFAIGEEFAKLGSFRVTDAKAADAARLATRPAQPAATGPPRRPAGPGLMLAHGRDRGTRFPLKGPGPWTIGRDEGQTVRVEWDPFASGRHAEVRLKGETFLAVDAFSLNGTTLNGEPLPKGEPVPMEAGDVLGVGKSLLVLQGRL